MPASKAEQVLEGLRALLETVPRRNDRPQQRTAREDPRRWPRHPERRRSRRARAGARRLRECLLPACRRDRSLHRGGRCRGPRRCLRRSPPADRRCTRSRPDPRRPRVRHDLWPARAGNRGGRGRTGNQDRDAYRDRRLRDGRTSRLTARTFVGDDDGASLWFERASAHEA